MFTLDDLLSTTNPHYAGFIKSVGRNWLSEESFQDLRPLQWEGRTVSAAELLNLCSHLVYHGHERVRMIPEDWREDLYDILARKANENKQAAFEQGVRQLADVMAGPKSTGFIKMWLRDLVNETYSVPAMVTALWRLEGIAGLPLITEALSRRALYSGFRDQAWAALDLDREKLGITPPAWELLRITESALAPERLKKTRREQARKLRELMERNIRFSANDVRQFMAHPAHSENVRGLVLAVYDAAGTLTRTFVLPDPLALGAGESIAIAHPAALPAEEIARWQASFAAEGLAAPFNQWEGAGSTGLDLSGLHVEPCALFMRLEAQGWKRGRPDPNGVIRRHCKEFPDLKLRAEIEYSGVPTRYGSPWISQTIQSCHFFRPSGIVVAEAEVNPIVTSAIMADLAILREKKP